MRVLAARVCARCGGSGWIVRSAGGGEAAAPCPDCRSRAQKTLRIRSSGIPPRYFSRGFDVFSVHHPLQEKALTRSLKFVEAFPKVPRGLLFVGPCGVGKTHLCVAVLQTLLQEKGIRGRFVDETELLRRLQYSYGPDSPETEREVMLPLMEVDLLVWDDLGTGRPTEWVAETIRTVLNHRYTYEKPTILSTNWSLSPAGKSASPGGRRGEQPLSERVGRRLFSRLMEMCEIVEMEGPDARTEIHKARLDFQKSRGPVVPSGLLTCPRCRSKQVQCLDYSRSKRSGGRNFVEVSCLCGGCSEHFVSRFFPDTTEVVYPDPD